MKERSPQLASVHIFGPAGVDVKLKKYFDIVVLRQDPFPKNICINCHKKLEEIHLFARRAIKTDQFWKKYLDATNPNDLQITSPEFNVAFAVFAESIQSTNPIAVRPKKMKLRIASDKFITPVKFDGEKRQIVLNASPTGGRSPIIVRNNLDEKRQNLKVVLSSNKSAPPQVAPRINVKSESYLKMPVVNIPTGQIGQVVKQAGPPPLKVISGPQMMPLPVIESPPKPRQLVKSYSQLQQTRLASNPFADGGLKLGQVVKDIDLLTLILKALKWPYTNDDILVKIDRLKEQPFHQVIRNPYLLQDADLMQILNTILSPILLQKQQQLAQKQPLIPAFVSYKIPADLSVHLVTDEPNGPQTKNPPVTSFQGRVTNNARGRPRQAVVRNQKILPKAPLRSSSPIEILSDDDSIQMFEVNVDPALFFNNESQEKHGSAESAKKNKGNELVFKLQTKHKKKETTKKQSQDSESGAEKASEEGKEGVSDQEPTESTSTKVTETDDPKTSLETEVVLGKESTDATPPVTAPIAIVHQLKIEPELIIPDEMPADSPRTVTPVDSKVEVLAALAKGKPDKRNDSERLPSPNEDASADEEVWAEFKVTESPDTSVEVADKSAVIECVKDESSSDFDQSSQDMVIEETNDSMEAACSYEAEDVNDSSAPVADSERSVEESVAPAEEQVDDAEIDRLQSTEKTVEPTQEIVPCKQESDEVSEYVRATDECADAKAYEQKFKGSQNSRKQKIIIKEEIIIKQAVRRKESSSNEDSKNAEESPSSPKRGRRRHNISPHPSTKEEVTVKIEVDESEASEEAPIAKKSALRKNITSSFRNGNKRATRSLTAANASMNLRNSNTRRRICKQCGQSFKLLTDFLDHRKMHIESS